MEKLFAFLILAVMTASPAFAQEDQAGEQEKEAACACCFPIYDQFDFLLGNWEIRDSAANLVGTSRVETINDGCSVLEHWEWADGTLSGTVVRLVDKNKGEWLAYWMDSKGFTSEFTIERDDHATSMISSLGKSNEQPQITVVLYEPMDDSRVRFTWKISTSEESKIERQTWKIIFSGFYVPVAVPEPDSGEEVKDEKTLQQQDPDDSRKNRRKD